MTTGFKIDPGDANFDLTYGRKSAAYGPDEVGTHPVSDSPYGVHDLQGNAQEMVEAFRPGAIGAARGGSWYFDTLTGWLTNGPAIDWKTRSVYLGVRICAGL